MLLGLGAGPATALSCVEPEPIDWSTKLPAADGAAIGVVERVDTAGDGFDGSLSLTVRVTEHLHGDSLAVLEYTTPNFDPWGPYYEVGQEIAVLIEDGEVVDGQMSLCGPWFGPDELRTAAADYGDVEVFEPTLFERLLTFVETLLRLLFGR